MTFASGRAPAPGSTFPSFEKDSKINLYGCLEHYVLICPFFLLAMSAELGKLLNLPLFMVDKLIQFSSVQLLSRV